MDINPKNNFTQSRWFIFLVVYLSLIAVITGFCFLNAHGDFTLYHEYLLWGGAVVVILCLLMVDRDSTWFKPFLMRDWAEFHKVEHDDKPFQRNLRVVMLAGAAVIMTGFLWMKIFFYKLVGL